MGRNSKDNSLDRYEEVLHIFVRYHDYLTRPEVKPFLFFGIKTREKEAIKYINNVKKALKSLSKEERNIIQNEFYEFKKPLWWSKYYSRATYYRKRTYAVKSFLENFSL